MTTQDPEVQRRLLELALELGGIGRTEAVLEVVLAAARDIGARRASLQVPA